MEEWKKWEFGSIQEFDQLINHKWMDQDTCFFMWFLSVITVVFFKVFFTYKYIKIIFFLFFKNYFWNQCNKTSKNTKTILI